jgi:hypothetical protein
MPALIDVADFGVGIVRHRRSPLRVVSTTN